MAPRQCVHCGGNHRCFPRSRRSGYTVPTSTAHRFISVEPNSRICTKCHDKIYADPHTPCDICRVRSSIGVLSDALLIAADAARQQNQISTTISTPYHYQQLMPVTSSETLPAKVISTAITNREKVAFSILTGATYTQYKERELFTGGSMSKTTWYKSPR